MDEATLIADILSGNQKALHNFYTFYAPKLTGYIKHKVQNTTDAEEIFQDTLYAFLEALRDFHGKSSIQTFLFAIASHKVVDFYRRKKIKHVVFSQVPQLETLVSPLLTPEDELDAKILRQRLHVALRRILPQHKRVLLSKYIDNLSIADIAKRLTVSAKSAESLLFRARKAFVKAFVSI